MAYNPIQTPQPVKINNGTVDAAIEPTGQLLVNNGFQTLFYDSWSTALDTVDKWTVGGNAPTIATGKMTMSATPSSYNSLRTKDVIRSNVGFTIVRNGIDLETTAATGCGRFWGLGTPATTPAPGVLVQDGIGFEIDQATGALLAVTYAAGVRTTIATLTRPADGLTHAYGVYFRVTQAYWIVDNVQVASRSFPDIQVADLPALLVRQNAAAITGTPVFRNIAHLTADTSRQGMTVADPVIGTRQARVKAASTAAVATDNAMVVALHPTSPLPTGTNSIGSVTAVGNVAAGAADSGNPVKQGGVARTTNPTAVTDGQRSNIITDKLGKQVVVGSIRELKGRQVTTITSLTTEQTIVTAQGVGVFADLYGLVLSNTSATATEVTIRDVTGTGTASSFVVPAGQTVGFMLPESAAMPQGTANSAWTAQCTTSVASLKVTALFVRNT